MDVGSDAYIDPFCASINRGRRVDVGIDPYNVVIGAVGWKIYGKSVFLGFTFPGGNAIVDIVWTW